MAKDKKKKVSKRDIIELAVIVTIFAVIYFTGSQAEVFGRVQQVVLKTGVMNVGELEEDAKLDADYDMKLVDTEGNILDLQTLKGKTIFMNYWATWCAPCVAEMPSIDGLYEKVSEDPNIVFLMISEDKKMSTARGWVKRKGFSFPIYKLASPIADVYETGVVPTTFVISPEGKIVVAKTGMANYNSRRFVKLMKRLAAKASS
ncbi:MAG: hypothetical protein Roseis2KO_39880 [Roseivirga sp.]